MSLSKWRKNETISDRKWRKNETISDRNWKIPFGKFDGQTIQQILDGEQPSYLLWLVDNTDIDLSSDILDEADGLASDNPVDWWNVK